MCVETDRFTMDTQHLTHLFPFFLCCLVTLRKAARKRGLTASEPSTYILRKCVNCSFVSEDKGGTTRSQSAISGDVLSSALLCSCCRDSQHPLPFALCNCVMVSNLKMVSRGVVYWRLLCVVNQPVSRVVVYSRAATPLQRSITMVF